MKSLDKLVNIAEGSQRSSYLGRLTTGLKRFGATAGLVYALSSTALGAGNGGYLTKNNVPENSRVRENGIVGEVVMGGFKSLTWLADNLFFKIFQPEVWKKHPYKNAIRVGGWVYGLGAASSDSSAVEKVVPFEGQTGTY